MKVYFLHLTQDDFNQSGSTWTTPGIYDLYENNEYKNYSLTKSAFGTNLLGDRTWTGMTHTGTGPDYITDGGRVVGSRYIDHTGRIDIVNYNCIVTNNPGNETINPYLCTYTAPVQNAIFPGEWTEKKDLYYSGLSLHIDSYRYAKFGLTFTTDQSLIGLQFDLYIEINIGDPIIPAMARRTRTVLDKFPEWMTLREIDNVPATPSLATPTSQGGKLINAVAGEWLDDLVAKLDELRFQEFIGTASEDQLAYAYACVVTTAPFYPYSISGDGVQLTRCSDLQDFYDASDEDDICYWDGSLSKMYTRKKYTDFVINGVSYIQSKTHIWNWFDEFGLLVDLFRLPQESNTNFKGRILDVYINQPGVALDNFKLALRRELNLWQAFSATPATPDSHMLGATPTVYEVKDLERSQEFVNPDGMPTQKFLDIADDLAKSFPTTWGYFQWDRTFWDQAGDDFGAYGILPYNYDATPLTDELTKSGVGDFDDLLILPPVMSTRTTNFDVQVKAKGRVKSGTIIQYPEVNFDVELYGTANQTYYTNQTVGHWFTLDLTYNGNHYYHMFNLSGTSDYTVDNTTGTVNSQVTYAPFRGLFDGNTYTNPGMDWYDNAGNLMILDPEAPLGPFFPGPWRNDTAENVQNFGVMFPVTLSTPLTLHKGCKLIRAGITGQETYDATTADDFTAWFSDNTGSVLTNNSGTVSTTGPAVIVMKPKGTGPLTRVWESEHQTYRVSINGNSPATLQSNYILNTPMILWPDHLTGSPNKTVHIKGITIDNTTNTAAAISDDGRGDQIIFPLASNVSVNGNNSWTNDEVTVAAATSTLTFSMGSNSVYPAYLPIWQLFEYTSQHDITGTVDINGPWKNGQAALVSTDDFTYTTLNLTRADFGIPEDSDNYVVTWIGVEALTPGVTSWINVNTVKPYNSDLDVNYPSDAIQEIFNPFYRTYSYDPITVNVKLIPGEDQWNPAINSGWFYDRQQEYYLYANEITESATLTTWPLETVATYGAPIMLATNEATPKQFRQVAIWDEATPGFTDTMTEVKAGTGDTVIYLAYEDIFDVEMLDLNTGNVVSCDSSSSANNIHTSEVLDFDHNYKITYKVNKSFFADHTFIDGNFVPHTKLYLTEANPFLNYTVHYEGSTINSATPLTLPLNALYTSQEEGFIYIDFEEHPSGSFDINISPASLLADGQDYAIVSIRAYDVNGDPKYNQTFHLVTTFGTLEHATIITDHDGFASTNLISGATPTTTTGTVGATPSVGLAKSTDFAITKKKVNPYRLVADPNVEYIAADGTSKVSVYGKVQDGSFNPVPYANVRYRKGRSVYEVFTSADQGEVKSDVQGNFMLGPFTTSATPGYWFLAAESQYQGATPASATPMSTNYSVGATPYATNFPYAKTYLSLGGAGQYISSPDDNTIPVQAQRFYGGTGNYAWANIDYPYATTSVDIVTRARFTDINSSPGAILGSNSELLSLSILAGKINLRIVDNLGTDIGATSTVAFSTIASSQPTEPMWIKASKDLNTGKVTFSYSLTNTDREEFVVWTQFGDVINSSIGTGSVRNGLDRLLVGQSYEPDGNPLTGIVHYASWVFDSRIRNTYNPRKHAVGQTSTTWTEDDGTVWTMTGSTTKLISKYDAIYNLIIKTKVRATDWTNGTQTVVAKWNDATNQRSWSFEITAAGFPQFRYTTDGTTVVTRTSTTALTLTDNTDKWLEANFQPNNGTNQNVVTFYQSDDGINWTTLSTVTNSGTTTMFAGTADLSVGALADGANPFNGRVYYIDISGDDFLPTNLPITNVNLITNNLPNTPQGTPFNSLISYMDFTIQPSLYSTIHASTGEAWNLHGAASIQLFGHNVGDVVFWYEYAPLDQSVNAMNLLPIAPIQYSTDTANPIPYSYYNTYPATYDEATPNDSVQPNVLQWRPPQWYAINRYRQYQMGLLGTGFYNIDFTQENKSHPDYKDM